MSSGKAFGQDFCENSHFGSQHYSQHNFQIIIHKYEILQNLVFMNYCVLNFAEFSTHLAIIHEYYISQNLELMNYCLAIIHEYYISQNLVLMN